MSKKCKINWSNINGASPKPKWLHLEKDETDQLFQHWQIIHKMVDWKWWGLQERSFSPADSQEVFKFLRFCCKDEEEYKHQEFRASG